MKSRLIRLYLRYMQSLASRPVATKCATAATLSAVEELAAQSLTYSNGRNYEYGKVVRLALYGGAVGAPLSHYLYAAMNAALAGRAGWRVQALKLLLANTCIVPLQTLVYLAAMGVINNRARPGRQSVDERRRRAPTTHWTAAKDTVRASFVPIMKTTLLAFPLIQLIVFRYLDEALWVPVFQLIALLFGIYTNATAKKC